MTGGKQPGQGDGPSAADAPGPAMDQALDWHVHRQSGPWGAAEQAAFEAWRAADPAHDDAWRSVETIWSSPVMAAAARNTGRRLAAPPRPARPRPAPPRRRWPRLAAIAAALLITLGLGWHFDVPTRLQGGYVTEAGRQERVLLEDGSQIVLDTDTAIVTEMQGPRRRIRLLRGAAYFDVASEPGRPFEVQAGTTLVQVTGTAFAVRYLDGRAMVTVRHGLVMVERPDAAPVHLAAGQQFRLDARGAGLVEQVDPGTAMAWVDGRLVFVDQPLRDVLRELRRYHAGLIILGDDRLGAMRVTGNYRLDDPARTLAALAAILQARVTRLTDAVLIIH